MAVTVIARVADLVTAIAVASRNSERTSRRRKAVVTVNSNRASRIANTLKAVAPTQAIVSNSSRASNSRNGNPLLQLLSLLKAPLLRQLPPAPRVRPINNVRANAVTEVNVASVAVAVVVAVGVVAAVAVAMTVT